MSCSSGNVCISEALWNTTGAFAHIMSGAMVILTIALVIRMFVNIPKHRLFFILVLFVINIVFIVGYVVPKEMWYDENYESVDERGSATTDIFTFLGGAILGDVLAATLMSEPLDCGFNSKWLN